jgi:hypothetical protein
MQVPLQSAIVAAQEQAFALHAMPAGQEWPHEPQLLLSLGTQLPWQRSSMGGHPASASEAS